MKAAANSFWSLICGSVRGFDSTRQLAAGIVLGMFIGFIPKDSMFVYLIGIVTILSMANLLCAGISALVFTWVGTLCDPLTHFAGNKLLTYEPIEPLFAWLIQLPVVPWTRFDNTVVSGSLLIALLLAVPLYFAASMIIKRLRPAFGSTITQSHFFRWLIGSPLEPAGQNHASQIANRPLEPAHGTGTR